MIVYFTLNIDSTAVCQSENSQFFGEGRAAKIDRKGNKRTNYIFSCLYYDPDPDYENNMKRFLTPHNWSVSV